MEVFVIETFAVPSKEYLAKLEASEVTIDKEILFVLYVEFCGLITVIVGAVTSFTVKEVVVEFVFPAASVA